MPDIDLIPVPRYSALQHYHVDYDNLPLDALITRIGLVNSAVDIVSDDVRNAVGTAGTLANRIGASLNANGSLKPTAIDSALHNIGYHADGTGPDSVDYVRMKQEERDKLALVADEATSMTLEVQTISNIVLFDEGPVLFEPSNTILWTVTAPNKVKANLTFPMDSVHRHYYDILPQNVFGPPDWKTFTTGSASPFIEGSLRVHINGIRLSDSDEIYVPSYNLSNPWQLNQFTPDVNGLGFTLLNAITSNDIIRIDFEISLA